MRSGHAGRSRETERGKGTIVGRSMPSPAPTARQTAAIRFRGVRKSYKTHFWQRPVVSLDGLELEVREGEILGLIGPNGAGKTTAIKLALGLLFPDRGEVTLMGRPADEPSARAAVGYLPENPYFPDDLTGRELVDFAARMHGIPAPERASLVPELLERVGLGGAIDRKLRRYSKGMVQRAGMARALAGRPRLVILDEPMSGLDPVGRREFRDLILGLKRDGVTVLFASHVLSDAEMLCDRVAILVRGRLRELLDLGTLSRRRRILGWEVEVRGGQEIAGAEPISVRGEERLLRFPASATAGEILAAVDRAGASLQALVPQRERLEDLFLRAVGGEEEP
ncbi:MAG: ABC transporter ATP-binding protein [Acidobacteria bacterium]|nr:MAG: ABC transporter ATP-binding protein [Acidobacteriota bacterium]